MPPRRRRRPLLYALLISLLIVAGCGVALARGRVPAPLVNRVAGLFVTRQPGAVPRPPQQPVPGDFEQPVNVLVMGLQVGGASTNPLTDAMLVVSYEPRQGSIGMLSIPRDLWVAIPGHGSGRINEAFQDGGPYEAMLTVQQNLGIPVNYYALINYAAFERLIDDVGGITVDVPYELDDPTFPAPDEIHFEPFYIDKGIHRLNGHEALRYARERHADPQGDFGRAQRQQQVLLALRSELLRPANLRRVGTILRDMADLVLTNFPLDEAAGVLLKAMNAASVRQETLQYGNQAVTDWVTPGGAAVLQPNPPVIRAIVGRLFTPTLAYLRAGAAVRVDSGSGRPEVAADYSRTLAAMGVHTLSPGEAAGIYSGSRVRAYTRDPARVEEAGLLAGMLGVPLELAEGEETAEVVITLGRDFAPLVSFTEADWAAFLR